MTARDSTQLPPLAGFGIDRAAAQRATPDLLETARADAATRVLVIAGDAAPLAESGELLWASPDDVPDGAMWAFLGRGSDDAPLLAAAFAPSDEEPFPAPAGWAGLTEVRSSFSSAITFLIDARMSSIEGSRPGDCMGKLSLIAAAESPRAWSSAAASCRRARPPETDQS